MSRLGDPVPDRGPYRVEGHGRQRSGKEEVVDWSILGEDPVFNGFVGLLVIATLVMLFTRKPKGPGGRR